MPSASKKTSFTLAEKSGFTALAAAVLLSFISWYIALIPLILFLLLCITAPFLPTVSFFLPIISRAHPEENGVILTFDDGPDQFSTPVILKLLAKYQLKATFFVVGKRVSRYPGLVEEILSQGHTIGNHSWDHDYLLMLRSIPQIQKSIHRTQEVLSEFGIIPNAFRPPMGITGSRLGSVLNDEELIAVNYSCRALDRGNRNIDNLAAKILNRIRPGDIIMLHDLPPHDPTKTNIWQKELDCLFNGLTEKYKIIPLDSVFNHPAMSKDDSPV